MPFYAYAVQDNEISQWRQVIVFATRDVADEWWRAIQTAVSNKVAGWDTVSRITPQFFTYRAGVRNVRDSIAINNIASQLSTKIFFTLLNDRDGRFLNIIPTQFTKDHVNGKEFYIRSQRDPALYWYVNSGGDVILSRDDPPTPFLIGLREPLSSLPQPNVLIGSDDVVISVPALGGNKVKYVSTDDEGGLIVSPRPDLFKFKDFKDTFERVNSSNRDAAGKPRYQRVYKSDKNRGETWELV